MAIAPMPVISFDGNPYSIPNFAPFDFSGAFPSSHAIDDVWGGTHYWRAELTPTGNANSGTLTQPATITLALHNVPLGKRTKILVYWNQNWVTGDYDCSLTGRNPNNIATGYQIRGNAASIAGSPPSSGWVTLATVTGSNPYHSRQHYISDFSPYNWLQLYVTDITGSAFNNNVALKLGVHDASGGLFDSWALVGDSITSRGSQDDTANGMSATLAQQINALYPKFYPVFENLGVIGFTATNSQANFATWLALFPGKNVVFMLGTNDANNGGADLSNYSSKITNMVQQVLSAGKTPYIADPPWGGTANLLANIPTIIANNAAIIAANPGCKRGPNFYSPFNADHTLIDPTDHIHPTDPALATGNGYNVWRLTFTNWAALQYAAQQYFIDASHRKHRTVVF